MESLSLEGTGIKIDGMDSERIPVWFKIIVKYYNHRTLVIGLMQLFDIKFPKWAKEFKLPYDYNEDELDIFFGRVRHATMPNARYFEKNMGFYYRVLNSYGGDTEYLLRSSDLYIPWNLLLQNKLLTTEKYFNKILEKIGENAYLNEGGFFNLYKYQELSDDQVSRMLDKLPEGRLFSYHTDFVSNNAEMFKAKPKLVDRFLDRISNNQYSAFHYLNYPVEQQKEYVKNYRGGYYNKFDLVKNMKMSKEDKIKLLGEIAESELTEIEEGHRLKKRNKS